MEMSSESLIEFTNSITFPTINLSTEVKDRIKSSDNETVEIDPGLE